MNNDDFAESFLPIRPRPFPQFRTWGDVPEKAKNFYLQHYKDNIRRRLKGVGWNVPLVGITALDVLFAFGTDKKELWGKPYPHTPDLDNLVKGLLDSLTLQDCTVTKIRAEKVYLGNSGIHFRVWPRSKLEIEDYICKHFQGISELEGK